MSSVIANSEQSVEFLKYLQVVGPEFHSDDEKVKGPESL